MKKLNKTAPRVSTKHENIQKRRTEFLNKSNVSLDKKRNISPANCSDSFDYPPVDETEKYNLFYLEQKRQNVLRKILKEEEEKAKYPTNLFSKFTNLGKELRRQIYRDLSISYEDPLFDNQIQNKKLNDVINTTISNSLKPSNPLFKNKLITSEYSRQAKEIKSRNISKQELKLNADERTLLERKLIESSQRLKESLRYKKMNHRYPMREIIKYYKTLYQITSHLLGDDVETNMIEENDNSLEMKLLIAVMRLREKYHISGITLEEIHEKIQNYQEESEKKKENIVVCNETTSAEDKKLDENVKIKKKPNKHTKKMNKKQIKKKVEVEVPPNDGPTKTEKVEQKKSEPKVPVITKFVRTRGLNENKSDISSKSEFRDINLKDLSLNEIIDHLKVRIHEIEVAKKEKTERTKKRSTCENDVNNFIPLTKVNLSQKNLDEFEPNKKVRDFLKSLEPPGNFVCSQNEKVVENNTKMVSSSPSIKITSKVSALLIKHYLFI